MKFRDLRVGFISAVIGCNAPCVDDGFLSMQHDAACDGATDTQNGTSGLPTTGGVVTDSQATGDETTGSLSSSCEPSVGVVGEMYATQLSQLDGLPPFTWESLDPPGLAPGLTLDPTTGLISGVPTIAGEFPLDLVVVDSEDVEYSQSCTIEVFPPLESDIDKLLTIYPDGCVGSGVTLQDLIDNEIIVGGTGEPIICDYIAGPGNGNYPEGISTDQDDCSVKGVVDPSEEYGMHVWITTFSQGTVNAYVPYCALQALEGSYAISQTYQGVDVTFKPGNTKLVNGNTALWGAGGDPRVDVGGTCDGPNCFYRYYFDYSALSLMGSVSTNPNGKLGMGQAFEGFFHSLTMTDPAVDESLVTRPWVVNVDFTYCISDVDADCDTKDKAQTMGSDYTTSVIVRP